MADADPPVPYPQRNTAGHEVIVPGIPATVQPGEVVVWPHHLAGFEPVAPDPVPVADPVPVPVKKRPAADDVKGAGK